jgi:hypothetical protein
MAIVIPKSLPVSTLMRHFADVVVFSKGKDPVLIVEISATKETSPNAAARFRRSLIENELVDRSSANTTPSQ